MSHTIREYSDEDYRAIFEITMLAFAPIHESFKRILGNQVFSLVYPDWKKSHAKYLKSLCKGKDKKNILVVENDGVVVGFVSFFIFLKNKEGELGLNAVHPNHQGRGIGKKMYKAVLSRMKKRGVKFVKVGTGGDVSHLPARRAYPSIETERVRGSRSKG
jgi:ribosomal protein S18 acetylase RimI-like enzyme